MIDHLLSINSMLFIMTILFGIAFHHFIVGTFTQNAFIGFLLIYAFAYIASSTIGSDQVQHWIWQKYTIEIGILAFLILFSYELKRFLAYWTQYLMVWCNISSWIEKKANPKMILNQEEISQIIDVCEELKENQLGALIVIERKSAIDKLEEQFTGIKIDALISKALLYSIFVTHLSIKEMKKQDKHHPNKHSSVVNPTHDGAVIIRDHRIHRAGVILPLSEKFDMKTAKLVNDENLGTRHSAAIGISEKTDAIAIVISESHPMISYAYLNELTFDVSTDDLRSFLIQALYASK
jgi:diadenylate cyclase